MTPEFRHGEPLIDKGSFNHERFLHPNPPTSVELPPSGQTSPQLYKLLDSGEVNFGAKGFIVRMRYPETAKRIDTRFIQARLDYEANPQNEERKKAYRKAIAITGAYTYIRGMEVLRKDSTVDRDVVPKMMLSPSASLQLLEEANITEKDAVLDLFCGAGYLTFALATTTPQRLDAVDNYTIPHYRLPETMQRASEMIYTDVPDSLKPALTMPQFITEDCTKLPRFDNEEAEKSGFAHHYDKVFMHPPYGRESTKIMPEISEGDAFVLWVNALRSVRNANGGKGTVYSIIPEEWKAAIQDIREGVSVSDAIRKMYGELGKMKYYQFDDNRPKLSMPVDLENAADWTKQELDSLFRNSSHKALEETGMFGLDLHKIALS